MRFKICIGSLDIFEIVSKVRTIKSIITINVYILLNHRSNDLIKRNINQFFYNFFSRFIISCLDLFKVYCFGAGLNWETFWEFYLNVLPWRVLRSWFFQFSKIFETARPCWLVKSIYETCWHFIKYCIGCHIFHTLVGWINYFQKPTVFSPFFEIS